MTYTVVHVTFEGQNEKASFSKELNKVKEIRDYCMMCYLDLCTSVSTIFLSKMQCQITSRIILEKS